MSFSGQIDADCAAPKWSHPAADSIWIAIKFLFENAKNFFLNFIAHGEIVDLRDEFKGLCRNPSELNRRYPDAGIDNNDQADRFTLRLARTSVTSNSTSSGL